MQNATKIAKAISWPIKVALIFMPVPLVYRYWELS